MMNMDAELFHGEQELSLEEQLKALKDGAGHSFGFFINDKHDKPWDHWEQTPNQELDLDWANVLKVAEPSSKCI